MKRIIVAVDRRRRPRRALPFAAARAGTAAAPRRRERAEEGRRRGQAPAPKLADGTVDLSGVWTGGGDAPIPRLLEEGRARCAAAAVGEAEDGVDQGSRRPVLLLHAWRAAADHRRLRVAPRADPDRARERTSSCCRKGTRTASGRSSWTAASTRTIRIRRGIGHSIGHWEGHTLVVDTVGLNDKFWLDSAGTPHTEKLHLIERYTRTDYNTLQRVVTIDDPGTFTKPFDVTYTAKLGDAGQRNHRVLLHREQSVGRTDQPRPPRACDSQSVSNPHQGAGLAARPRNSPLSGVVRQMNIVRQEIEALEERLRLASSSVRIQVCSKNLLADDAILVGPGWTAVLRADARKS